MGSIENNLNLKYVIVITNYEKDIESSSVFLSFVIYLIINNYHNYIDKIISIYSNPIIIFCTSYIKKSCAFYIGNNHYTNIDFNNECKFLI